MGCPDCRRGPCAHCLAEDDPPNGMTFSTVGNPPIRVPNYDDQELVATFQRWVIQVEDAAR